MTIGGQDGAISFWSDPQEYRVMHVPTVSLIAYAAMVIAAIVTMPIWPWSRTWGNANSGAIAYILLVVSINALLVQALA